MDIKIAEKILHKMLHVSTPDGEVLACKYQLGKLLTKPSFIKKQEVNEELYARIKNKDNRIEFLISEINKTIAENKRLISLNLHETEQNQKLRQTSCDLIKKHMKYNEIINENKQLKIDIEDLRIKNVFEDKKNKTDNINLRYTNTILKSIIGAIAIINTYVYFI